MCSEWSLNVHFVISIYSIVRTFVTHPFPMENPRKLRKSLVNSDFELEKSEKKENYGEKLH